VALVGSTAYGTRAGLGAAYLVASFDGLVDGGAVAPVYTNPPVAVYYTGHTSFAASSGFVACSGEVLGNGGVELVDAGVPGYLSLIDAGGGYALFMCAGGTCTSPTRVAGVDAKTITALYADATTLYFTDKANDLFACDAAAALAGSCTPKLLSCPVPPFTELRSDASYVYLLKSDGSAIVRIAR
jgi:hypothetical protein